MNKRKREQLQADLAAEREALLTVASDVDAKALSWPTRNSDWTVRDVLAHVLASDADLISLLEAAGRSDADPLRLHGLEQHQREMARWTDATPQALAEEMRQRGDRWRELLAALPDSASEVLVGASGWIESERKLLDVVGDWREHDTQHAEDVRLALANGPSDASR
jgi:hypothetical protein